MQDQQKKQKTVISNRQFSSNIRRATSVPVQSTTQERSLERIDEINLPVQERSFLLRAPETNQNLAGPSPLQVIEERAHRSLSEHEQTISSVAPPDLAFRHSLTDLDLGERFRAVQERAQTLRNIDEIGRGVAEIRQTVQSDIQEGQAIFQQVTNIPMPLMPAQPEVSSASTISAAEMDWRDNPAFVQNLVEEEWLLGLLGQANHSLQDASENIGRRQAEATRTIEELTQNSERRREENQAFFRNYEEETERSVERTTRILRFVNLAVGVVSTAFALPFLHDLVRVGTTVARETGLVHRIANRFPLGAGGGDSNHVPPTTNPSVAGPISQNVPESIPFPASSTGVYRGANTDISDWSAPPQK